MQEAPTERDDLHRVMADPKLGAAQKVTFWMLWQLAERRPNEIHASINWMCGLIGRDRKSLKDAIKALDARGLIQILDRDTKLFRLYVFQPNPGEARSARPDPQTRLPLRYGELDESNAKQSGGPPKQPGISTAKSPVPPIDPGISTAKSPDPNHQTPQNTADPPIEPGVLPSKSPVPPINPGVSTAKSPDPNHQTPQNTADPPIEPGISPSKSPVPFIGTKERQSSNLPKCQSFNDTGTNEGGRFASKSPVPPIDPGISTPKSPAGVDPVAEGPVPIGLALLDVPEEFGRRLDEAADPRAQKAALLQRIKQTCWATDPKHRVADWCAGAAADLVLKHGVPAEELDAILVDVEAMRAAGTLKVAAAFFHSKVRTLAAQYGKPWPGKTKTAIKTNQGQQPR